MGIGWGIRGTAWEINVNDTGAYVMGGFGGGAWEMTPRVTTTHQRALLLL